MTPPITKRIDFVVTPKLQELGFMKIYSIDRMIVLETKGYGIIFSKFDPKDPSRTANKFVMDSLNHCAGFKDQKVKEIIKTDIMNMLFEALKQQYDKAQSEEQKQEQTTKAAIDEIDKLREQHPNLTAEEWRKQLLEKLQTLKNVVNEQMPEIWPGLQFELSIHKILDLDKCNLPFIGIILGRPSSYKTVIISLLKDWHNTYYTDNFTPKSFVTHTTAVDNEEELSKIDMLPRIKNKLFLTPELAPLFTSKEEDLTTLLGIVTRVADGQGYLSDSGAHGQRGYDGEYMLVWVGAAVDIPYKVYKILHNLGPRFYFFRMEFEEQTKEELETYAIEDEDFNAKVMLVKNALFDYLKWFAISPILTPKVKWDFKSDSREALKYIAAIADLLSFLRCTAKVWETKESQGSEYGYTISQREKPTRAISHLKNLARGLALLEGRNYITMDDVTMIIKTAMDTAQIERVSMLHLLIANNGKLSADEILDYLNVSKPTALRTMAELEAIGLVNISETTEHDTAGRPSKLMVLNPRFDWFLEDKLIKKIIPHTTPINPVVEAAVAAGAGNGSIDDLTKQYIVMGIFDELQKQEAALNIAEVDKTTVNRQKLEQRLIGTGQFFNGDATRMITQMLKDAKLIEVMQDTLKKV
jgi:predicted transcriptional regulator